MYTSCAFSYSVTIATVTVAIDKDIIAVDKLITRKIPATSSVESSWTTTKYQTFFTYVNKILERARQINLFNCSKHHSPP